MALSLRPPPGTYGIDWDRIPERCLRPFVVEDERQAGRIREREISEMPISMTMPGSPTIALRCLDISATGFRVSPVEATALAAPELGNHVLLTLPNSKWEAITVSATVIWCQVRRKVWECGLQRDDIQRLENWPDDKPKSFSKNDVVDLKSIGAPLPAWIQHPYLYQEWFNAEVIAIDGDGRMRIRSDDPAALALLNDIPQMRILLAALKDASGRLKIESLNWCGKTLEINARLLPFPLHLRLNLAAYLMRICGLREEALLAAKFPLPIDSDRIDFREIVHGHDQQRRLVTAFRDGKMIASLAIEFSNLPRLPIRIEALALPNNRERAMEVLPGLFGHAGRTLLLSDAPYLCFSDMKSDGDYLKSAGFSPIVSSNTDKIEWRLSRHQLLSGLSPFTRSWQIHYARMIEDLSEKGILQLPLTVTCIQYVLRLLASSKRFRRAV